MNAHQSATWSVRAAIFVHAFAACAVDTSTMERPHALVPDAGALVEMQDASDSSLGTPDASNEASRSFRAELTIEDGAWQLRVRARVHADAVAWLGTSPLRKSGVPNSESMSWLLPAEALESMLAGHTLVLALGEPYAMTYAIRLLATARNASGSEEISVESALKPVRFGETLLLRSYVQAPERVFEVRVYSEVEEDPVAVKEDEGAWRIDVSVPVLRRSVERSRPIFVVSLDDAGRVITSTRVQLGIAISAQPHRSSDDEGLRAPCHPNVRDCLDRLPPGKLDTSACGGATRVDACGGLHTNPWVAFSKSTFRMGCESTDDACVEGETPAHGVTLSPFELQRTEVTEDMMYACAIAGACELPVGIDPAHRGAMPVVRVRPDEADDYCAYVGGRLPTEAEWELGARGVEGRIYPWGNEAPDCARALWGTCKESLMPAGSRAKGATPSGLFDMAGSVFEWVADGYDPAFYENAPEIDPFRAPDETTPYRVIRGGTFEMDDARLLRATARSFDEPTYGFSFVGFRCARPMNAASLPLVVTPARFARDLRRHLVGYYEARSTDIERSGGRRLVRAKHATATWRVQQVVTDEEDPHGHDLARFVVYRHPDPMFPGSDVVWFGAYLRETGELADIYSFN